MPKMSSEKAQRLFWDHFHGASSGSNPGCVEEENLRRHCERWGVAFPRKFFDGATPEQKRRLSIDLARDKGDDAWFDMEWMETLLANGATMEVGSASAVYRATDRKEPKVLAWLVSKGGDITRRTKNGGTPLHRGCHRGSSEVAGILIDRARELGVLEMRNGDGDTPFSKAVQGGKVGICQMLMDAGANVLDDQEAWGWGEKYWRRDAGVTRWMAERLDEAGRVDDLKEFLSKVLECGMWSHPSLGRRDAMVLDELGLGMARRAHDLGLIDIWGGDEPLVLAVTRRGGVPSTGAMELIVDFIVNETGRHGGEGGLLSRVMGATATFGGRGDLAKRLAKVEAREVRAVAGKRSGPSSVRRI